jgi:hypothetical protein
MATALTDEDRRERDRLRSAGWWEQRMALGICAACRRPLPDDFDKQTPMHTVCNRLQSNGYRFAQLRAMTPEQIAAADARIPTRRRGRPPQRAQG